MKLVAHGASVVVNDLDEAPAAEVIARIRDAGGRATACVGDVTDDGFGERFIGGAPETFGGARHHRQQRRLHARRGHPETVRRAVPVHARRPCDHAVPYSARRSGAVRALAARNAAEGREALRKVVNVSSVAGTCGNAGQGNYAAKAGVIGLTKSLARGWARFGVCVNCVAFGFIDTRLTRSSRGAGELTAPANVIPDAAREALLARIPLGRAGTAEEAAGASISCALPRATTSPVKPSSSRAG